jgi:hypothetical protein
VRDGRVDEPIVPTVPVLIGRGRPLFGPLPGDVGLELVESRSWPGGFVQNRWRPRPSVAGHGGVARDRVTGRPAERATGTQPAFGFSPSSRTALSFRISGLTRSLKPASSKSFIQRSGVISG